MSIATMDGTDPGEENSVSTPFPNAWWGRVLYGIYVIVAPILAFGGMDVFKPEWQSGDFSAYLKLFLFPEASLVFFLLLAYSVICYLSLLISPTHDAKFFLVRFGIYTGVLLALQYSILAALFFFTSFPPYFILVWAFPIVYSIMYRLAVARWTARKVDKFLLIIVLGGLLLTGVITRGSVPFLVLATLTMAAPFWSLLLSLQAARWLIRNYETGFSPSRGAGLATWLAVYAAAWRYDILKMYELYAALPPTPPPDCYISTAAARGHPQLVRSWTVRRSNGTSLQVNTQLQHLKCAELALKAVNPHLHKNLRAIYDIVGERLARQVRNPYLADLAFLFLTPWDWLARLILRMIVPEIDLISSKIYMN